MAVITQRTNLAPGLGTAFGEGLTQGYEEEVDRRALQNAIGRLPPNASPQEILKTLVGTKASPGAKQEVFKNLMGAAEFEQRSREFSESKKLKEAELKARQDAAAAKPAPKSEFEKTYERKLAEEYIKLPEEIAKLDNTLGDIAETEKLSKELGVVDVALAVGGLSPKSKEMEALSFTLMEPIVKIFNPSGPIAEKKLRTIQDKYVIKGTDAPWNRQAKLNALRRFAEQAKSRALARKNLIEKYKGVPPQDKLEQFDKESESISDAMMDYDITGEEVKIEGLPPAEKHKNKTINGPNGEKLYSDGTRWVKK